jgi:hypothetical protein
VASVSVGPFVAEIGPAGVTGQLLAMRQAGDISDPGDVVLVVADTAVATRVGPTGILALGVAT